MTVMKFTAPVIHGRHLGSSFGVPTINQTPPKEFEALPRGVYLSRVSVGGKSYPAVSNLGVKPTVDSDGALLCETHILGFEGDLYGCDIETELIRHQRPERKFSSLDELRDVLRRDIDAAKEFFGS